MFVFETPSDYTVLAVLGLTPWPRQTRAHRNSPAFQTLGLKARTTMLRGHFHFSPTLVEIKRRALHARQVFYHEPTFPGLSSGLD